MSAPRIKFSTLGQFIIDTFSYEDPPVGDRGRGEVIGGGGTYATIGARVWLAPSECLMVVDRGSDFKEEWQSVLDIYARHEGRQIPATAHAVWKYRTRTLDMDTGTGEPRSELTTKAVNVYRGERREFKYLTPRLRLTPRDLVLPSHPDAHPKWIHCVCAPERIEGFKRDAPGSEICWEPLDNSAIPANLQITLQVMQHVSVFSPNHVEAALFLGVPLEEIAVPDDLTLDSASHIRQRHLQLLACEFEKRFYETHPRVAQCPIIVIRSGAAGCVATDGYGGEVTASIPSYHLLADRQHDVTDVTGGGNTFLGGFVAALAQDPPLSLGPALVRASVSASLAIEQLGLPRLTFTDDGKELWNDQPVQDRVDVYSRV